MSKTSSTCIAQCRCEPELCTRVLWATDGVYFMSFRLEHNAKSVLLTWMANRVCGDGRTFCLSLATPLYVRDAHAQFQFVSAPPILFIVDRLCMYMHVCACTSSTWYNKYIVLLSSQMVHHIYEKECKVCHTLHMHLILKDVYIMVTTSVIYIPIILCESHPLLTYWDAYDHKW